MKERLISVSIGVLALAAFQPFGLPLFGWMRFLHLIGVGISAAIACGISELFLMAIGLGRSMDHGVKYIIRRNLVYQFVNTPLLALFLCLYRHFFLYTPDYDNSLNWNNYLETFVCHWLILERTFPQSFPCQTTGRNHATECHS